MSKVSRSRKLAGTSRKEAFVADIGEEAQQVAFTGWDGQGNLYQVRSGLVQLQADRHGITADGGTGLETGVVTQWFLITVTLDLYLAARFEINGSWYCPACGEHTDAACKPLLLPHLG